MKQYSANLAKGKEIIEYYVNELMNQGITSVPMWTEPSSSSSSSSDHTHESTATTNKTILINEDPSLLAARRRLSSQDPSNIFVSSSSPPKAAAITPTTASHFSALSDELETFQIDENVQEKQRIYTIYI